MSTARGVLQGCGAGHDGYRLGHRVADLLRALHVDVEQEMVAPTRGFVEVLPRRAVEIPVDHRPLQQLERSRDQAVDRVSRYLDDTMVTDLHEVRIVHGHGTGQLRKGIEWVSRHLNSPEARESEEITLWLADGSDPALEKRGPDRRSTPISRSAI